MRVSIWPRPNHRWEDVVQIVGYAERLGWDGAWFADHFMPNTTDRSGPILECFATLSALAGVVGRLRLGSLVAGNTYRHPAVLANAAATLDHVSGGRAVLGLGAGWQENEHAAYGIAFPRLGERMDRLEEACAVLQALRDRPRTTFHGKHYTLDDAPMEPKPSGPLPLLVGGGGERRTIPIAARYADEWNVWGDPERFGRKSAVLDRACETLDRDPGTVARSAQALIVIRAPGLPDMATSGRRPTVEGTFDEVRETIARYVALGLDELIVPDFHLDSVAQTLALIDALTREVLPPFR